MKIFLDGMSQQDLVGSRPVWARAFFTSMVEDDLVKFKALVKSHIDLSNAHDSSGRTPLHWCAYHGRQEMVRILLALAHVDVNARDCMGHTPLHHAVLQDHVDLVRLLLTSECAADASIKDVDHMSPSDLALFFDSFECLHVLRAHS